MHSIEFSHVYDKFPIAPSPSTLLEVFVVDHDLHQGFVEYDTTVSGGGKHRLPYGKKIVLLFQTRVGYVWTTVREFTDAKYQYYIESRGEQFDIVINEANDMFGSRY